jgi:hypothetical protein
MFMAMAYILFKQDLWDKEFVAKFVEPEGFEKWRSYILGAEDGIEKTPEWAESKCAVPAETIRALALLIGRMKPAQVRHYIPGHAELFQSRPPGGQVENTMYLSSIAATIGLRQCCYWRR